MITQKQIIKIANDFAQNGAILPLKIAIEEVLTQQREEYIKEWNCKCKKPKPDGYICVGKAEGRYERCKTCDRRIWA